MKWMLDWMRSIDWAAIVGSVLTILFGLFIFLLVAHLWKSTSISLNNWLHDNENRIEALSTLAVAIFTVTLWRATTRQGQLTREAINDAKQSSEHQLRAYISLKKARIYDVQIGKKPIFKIWIKNSGQTPAYEFMAHFTPAILPYPAAESYFAGEFRAREMSKVALAPGQVVDSTLKFNDELLPDQAQAINNGTGAIYIIGRIEYRDAFQNCRFKNIRLMYAIRGISSGSDRLEACELGNGEN